MYRLWLAIVGLVAIGAGREVERRLAAAACGPRPA
jgi:hypothetical protein